MYKVQCESKVEKWKTFRMSEKVLQLSFQATQLEILQNSFICAAAMAKLVKGSVWWVGWICISSSAAVVSDDPLHHVNYISGICIDSVLWISGKPHMWPCASCLQLTPNDQNNMHVKVEVCPVRAVDCRWLAQDCRGVLKKVWKITYLPKM